MHVKGLSVVALALAAGCTRDPAGECPAVNKGELAITELRGDQTDMTDTDGIWVELYNTSSHTIDLEGIKLRYRTIDGSTDIPVLVRRSVPVSAGAYAVLGLVPDDGSGPSFVDYGFSGDFHQGYLAAAAIDMLSCDTVIDRVVYRSLPKTGTYSYGGTPSADGNDDPTMWCTNMTPAGTPKMENPPCPPP